MTLAIEISNLAKTYNQKVKAVDNLSFTVQKGDFFGFLGPNGAGKSTTISIIASLVKKDSGLVRIAGFDLDHDLAAVKKSIGLVPQEFNFSIFETCQEILVNQAGYFGIEATLAKRRADQYLQQLGIANKTYSRSGTLSGGMKRRLMIARAMIHDPEILILDEPTAGLDVEVRHQIYQFLQEINQKQGKTIILTTHYFEEVEQLCNNIAIINHGKILLQDSLKNIFQSVTQNEFIISSISFETNRISSNIFDFTFDAQNNLCCKLRPEQSIDQLILFLRDSNIKISSIRSYEKRLEDIFLRLINNK